MADFKSLLNMVGQTVQQGPADDAFTRNVFAAESLPDKERSKAVDKAKAEYIAAIKRDEARLKRNAGSRSSTEDFETDAVASGNFNSKVFLKSKLPIGEELNRQVSNADMKRNEPGLTGKQRDELEKFILKRAAEEK